MNQSDLIRKIADTAELTEAAAGRAVKAMVAAILDGLAADEPIRIFGFGTFAAAPLAGRRGRNPRTGESIEIRARTALRFRASKTLKDALNPKKETRSPARKRVARK